MHIDIKIHETYHVRIESDDENEYRSTIYILNTDQEVVMNYHVSKDCSIYIEQDNIRIES